LIENICGTLDVMVKSPGNFFLRLALPETRSRVQLSAGRRFLRGVPVFLVLLLFLCVPVQRAYPVSLPLIDFSKGPVFSVLSGADDDNPLVGVRHAVSSDPCFHPVDLSKSDSPDVLTCSHDAPLIKILAAKSFSVLVPDRLEEVFPHRRMFPPGVSPDNVPVFLLRSSPPPNLLPV